ncbi:alpha/beta hydrolase [Phenylobacterium sp.]|uniref:alpha/beta hydrolase n=1 Tax=Phenylobacterium sp. TaxID=1871053 RepID=UPI00286AE3B0|nr:alpha/beta hydrolase [Phenylobacterium sp.]
MAVLAAPGAHAQSSLSLQTVIQAYEANDLPVLEQASRDAAFIASIEAIDPEAAGALLLNIARRLEDDVAAEAAYRQALAFLARLKGPDDVTLAEPLAELAEVQLRLGDRAQALLSLNRALTIMSQAMGDDHELVAPYRLAYEAALGRPDAASGTRAGGRTKLPYHLVEIFYATHRVPTGGATPAGYYSGRSGPMRFGRAIISLPNDRDLGELPRASIFALEFKPDPAKHVVLTSIKPYSDRAQFMTGVSQRVSASKRKEVFVFIHGFNTSFQGAAERTAQLADDLAIDGAPILYSWPSKANPLAYREDEAEAAKAAQLDDLATFLADVAARTGATRVNLVAHSMGNRFLTRALSRLAATSPTSKPRFNEIVLAAPDVGVDDFVRLWPKIRPLGARYTVYSSSRDRALELSGQINQMARLGDARTKPIANLETVDTTAASAGLLGHSDFAGTALDDFRAVIWASLAPGKRCVLQTRSGAAWAFTNAGCPASDFRSVLGLVRTSESPAAALQRIRASAAAAQPAARSRLQRLERQLQAIVGAP